ncbi:ATP-binding cassette domain-containing protein [Ruegeria marina]|uniref:Phosphate ABC transporter ATP-binding protein, PhoT family (TC 3.A.1.7.1) n=1 Tax=Ruegeria marina TaxID=639004 RepID=A0A1G6QTW2_9RHOB|nr:ATP-binding cassette domain-containing protein [Ruegeria marina]SDC95137.1 phosphate ABC transporter ATP-binding protein, PhoT family (TC 3.A.1.7.1) [Ruegeria marina]
MRDLCNDTGVLIEATGLRLVRGTKHLLDIPHLRLGGPGPTVILGPNGAGKSLLLRCLHGLIRADAGQVRQDGIPLDGRQRMRQAMVFQRPVLLRRSVAANLDFVLRRQGLPRAVRRERIAELLETGGLSGRERQWARSLSGGEAQRLAILRALATEPDVLFLDEPTSALDPGATQAIEALVKQASAKGVRIVMVTHDIGQARRLARDVVVMIGGRIAEHGDALHVFDNATHGTVRRFLAGDLIF